MKQPEKPRWKKKVLALVGAAFLGAGTLFSGISIPGIMSGTDSATTVATETATSYGMLGTAQADENIIRSQWSGRINYLSNEFNGGAWPGEEIIQHETNWVFDIVAQNNLPALKNYLDNGGNLHVNGEAILRMAATTGSMDIVKFAVDNNADVTALQNQAVRNASLGGHQDVVKYLIDHGADKNAAANPGFYKTTPGPARS